MNERKECKNRGSYFRTLLMTLSVVLAAGLCQMANAAPPLCVNQGGTGGCFSTIGAAVAAAMPSDMILVAPGTYDEDVMITKPVTLIGSNAVINASNQSNGIYIDGMGNPGLRGVVVSGFTVEDAEHEGILVTNASSITLQDNQVLDNDKSLSGGACSGLPSFEIPGENLDCGEGIHLMDVSHSTVAGNTVEHNAGGILLSDETGPTVDNLIAGNKVEYNLFDCGITLASHRPYSGIYDNTIADNVSVGNGTGIPGAGVGAGVGLFSPVPNGRVSGNVVTGNRLMGNGGPGVALHSHTQGQDLNDNVITANQISGNGADNGGAPTLGPTGINVYGISNITGTVISHNVINDEVYDIVVSTNALVKANLNDLLGGNQGAYGVYNNGSVATDARQNWWGCVGGPASGASGCSMESGSVFFAPWLRMPTP